MSIATNLQRLVTAKSDIADAITTKGGTVNQGDGFEEFAEDIASIPSGGSVDYTVDVKPAIYTKPLLKRVNAVYEPQLPLKKQWKGMSKFSGDKIWSDGTNAYYSGGSVSSQFVLDKETMTWNAKTWNLSNIDGSYIWRSGSKIMHSTNVGNSNYYLDLKTGTWKFQSANNSDTVTASGSSVGNLGGSAYVNGSKYLLWWNGSGWSIQSSTNGWGYILYPTSLWSFGGYSFYSNGSDQMYMSGGRWTNKSWNGVSSFYRSSIWIDEVTNTAYLSSGSSFQYVLDLTTSTWTQKTWFGFTNIYGAYIWSDGTDMYYSKDYVHYKLDRSTSTWIPVTTWNIFTDFNGSNVWSDGVNVYYSSSSINKVLISEDTWADKNWNGLSNIDATKIWSDGTDIYYSADSSQYVLDKSTSTWNAKTWTGLTSFNGGNIWSDGTDIYYSTSGSQYVLDKSTSTWSTKQWKKNGSTSSASYFSAGEICKFGEDYYLYSKYSNSTSSGQTISFYKLNKSESNWIPIDAMEARFLFGSTVPVPDSSSTNFNSYAVSTDGLTVFSDTISRHTWSDGENLYYSYGTTQYALPKFIGFEES